MAELVLADQQENSHQLCVDAGCSLEDLLGAVDNWDGWREREIEIERERGESAAAAWFYDEK